MTPDETGTKEKIFQATLELVTRGADAQRLTTRQIAAEAEVNPALVNYYYQSKENLLGQVVGAMMGEIIGRELQNTGKDTDPRIKLKALLFVTADAAFKHYHVCRTALSIELKRGCVNSCEMVLPLLKEIFPEAPDSKLDILALQLMLPFHHLVIDPEIYGNYLKADFFDPLQRKNKINEMIDCILEDGKNSRPREV
ncbi:MAG: TetR/AcrR family transcriptional regulator [Spirochaetales bacterium]|nr:TetR/AcrR family transcriptional regulator [Spirochaetales bacterium]